jgi:hypothetical protein
MQASDSHNPLSVEGVRNPQWYASAATFGNLIWTSGLDPVNAHREVPSEFGERVTLTVESLRKTLEAAGAPLRLS